MAQWWDETGWLRLHVLVAPFGVFAATLLYTLYLEQCHWQGRDSWALAGAQVDMGAVLYGMAAVAVERSVVFMFWALAQRRKWQARLREEGRVIGVEEGLAKGRVEGREEGLVEGHEKGREEGREEGRTGTWEEVEEWLAKVAEDRNIPIDELLPPQRGSGC